MDRFERFSGAFTRPSGHQFQPRYRHGLEKIVEYTAKAMDAKAAPCGFWTKSGKSCAPGPPTA
jgi:hypothetical protein